MKHIKRTIVLGCGLAVLTACGADEVASPGAGNVDIDITTPAPPPPPPATGGNVTPAGACPTLTNNGSVVLTDTGTISGPTGEYRKCELPSLIGASVTLPKIDGLLYVIPGRVDVGCDGGFSAPSAGSPYATTTATCVAAGRATLDADTNVTLSIDPGVVLYASSGQAWIAVNRGNQIDAEGTADAPIVFTSQDNVAGLNNDNSIGQWGGVVLLGRAPITGPCQIGSTAGGTCERDTEGAVNTAFYGGNDPTYDAGTMRYFQIRYSGFALSGGSELQSLTPSGIGTGTQLDHFQSHNSSDDGTEFFGGTVNLKYYVATGADDDSLDVDNGSQANIQYALLWQRPGQGDALMEIDSNGNEGDSPRTRLRVSNFLAYQPNTSANNEGADKASTLFRGNADVTLYNGAIITPNNECIRMTSNTDAANRATLTARSVVLQCSGTGSAKFIGDGSGSAPFTADQVAMQFGSGSNNNDADFTNTLTGFVNGANENGVATTDPVALNTGGSSFFSAMPTPFRIGVAWEGNDSWYVGWTCNAGYADFGARSSDCTSLPTT